MRVREALGLAVAVVMVSSGVGVVSAASLQPTSVIAYLKGAAEPDLVSDVRSQLLDFAATAQRPLLAWLADQGAEVKPFHIVNAVLVNDANPRLLRKLAARPEVERLVADRPVVLDRASVAAQTAGGNITATGAPRVWDLGFRGEGVVVGSLDTGVDWAHPALKPRYRGWDGRLADHRHSWHDAIKTSSGNSCGTDLRVPCDDNGHGTHTTGTMVGDDGAGNQIGMAPGAKWIGCRAMDEGVGRPSTYIECAEWFLAPYPQGSSPSQGDPSKRPDVINFSAACLASEGCTGSELVPVIRNLAAAGIVVVSAAGNSGPGCGTIADQPATVSGETLSVGAYSHSSGVVGSFSSRGPSRLDGKVGPDVVAPGVSIRSSVPGGGYGSFGWSGTSMAASHVVGEIALLLNAKPGLRGNVAEIMRIVTTSATPKTTSQTCGGVSGSSVPNNTWGHGVIDAYQAVTRPD